MGAGSETIERESRDADGACVDACLSCVRAVLYRQLVIDRMDVVALRRFLSCAGCCKLGKCTHVLGSVDLS